MKWLTFFFLLALHSACSRNAAGSDAPAVTVDSLPHSDSTGYFAATGYRGLQLTWADEFDEPALNMAVWNYDLGASGWGNHELENYTDRAQNSYVSQGNLVIAALHESLGGANYTSARLTTKGKKEFRYGRIDIRAKIPTASGLWPALWMMGSNIDSANWPACGEIDIMELIGLDAKKVYGTLHWKGADGQPQSTGENYSATEDFSKRFHVFSLVWTADSLNILVDDKPMLQRAAGSAFAPYDPFQQPFYFLLDVAVGGDWPGPPSDNGVFPQKMFVDYIRVYQPK